MGFLRKKGLFESSRVQFLPVGSIVPNPNQPRQSFEPEGLQELAGSIREVGILQPLSVRRQGGSYELVSGERRLRAAKLCGLEEVPCILLTVDEERSSLLALIENLQRRDLDFWEEAVALDKLIRTYHLSQEEAARRLGRSQPAVANKLRLLKLSPECLLRLRTGGLTERHGRALLRLEDESARLSALEEIIARELNVAQTDAYIESLLAPSKKPLKKKPTYIIKDVRLFLNTINRGLSLMKSAGVEASCRRDETEQDILLTIKIPK